MALVQCHILGSFAALKICSVEGCQPFVHILPWWMTNSREVLYGAAALPTFR